MLSSSTFSNLEKCKSIAELRQIHAHMIKTNLIHHSSTVNKLIAAICGVSGGGLDYASSVFLRIQIPSLFIFFELTKGFCNSSSPLESVVVYCHMLSCLNDLNGIEFSLPFVLKSCGRARGFKEGKQIHGQMLKTCLWVDPFVSNSIVRMYLDIGEIEVARQVFDKMPERDVIAWNSMITGYLRVGEIELACKVFNEMPEKDLVSCNAMIDGYGKSGQSELAEEVFAKMSVRDVISWTSMISGYVLNRRPREALDLFRKMLSLGVRPDAPAIVCVLSAIADLGFVEEGKWVHAYISKNRIRLTSGFIGSALIDMYSKCGYIENAYIVFKSVSDRGHVGDWNSMISGLAIHGLGQETVVLFLDMERRGIKPDEITFLGVLTACSHGGLVDEGQMYFKIMEEKYKIVPKIQHYGCLVDLYSRAGRLEDAIEVILNMPMEADILAWKSILSASMKHGNVKIGENAALQAIELNPQDSSCYILLSNIYAKARRWDDVEKVRLMMKQRGVTKIPGSSSIVINGNIHEFLVGREIDVNYSNKVLSKVNEVVSTLKMEGYEPDITQVLLDTEEDDKENLLNLHSEKMVLALGLLNTDKGTPIHIVKNLRICCDCHSYMKLVSKVFNVRVIVRDQNRFHQFENGSCSCNDYW